MQKFRVGLIGTGVISDIYLKTCQRFEILDVVVTNTTIGEVERGVVIERFSDDTDEKALKEVHTQIVGFGKMQQCLEQDIRTLYLEEPMAPGATHKPMYDEEGQYPWHQYETITPGIFMAIEMLPSDEPGVE